MPRTTWAVVGVVPGVFSVVPSPSLSRVASWGLPWCCLYLPGVVYVVVVGVLGHTVVLLTETPLVFLKLKEKKRSSPSPVAGLLGPPRPHRSSRRHRRLGGGG
jgi:hypothetical protein